MIKNTFFIIFILISTSIISQTNFKYWSDAKLNWNDFYEKQTNNKITSNLKYELNYKINKQYINDTIAILYKAECFIDKSQSWVNPIYKSDQLLQYNQVIFNIVEFHRRALELSLNKIKNLNLKTIYENECYLLLLDIDKFQKESLEGQNSNEIIKWNNNIKKQLDSCTVEKTPSFTKIKWGNGIYFGTGTSLFTGSINEHFSQSANLFYGCELSYLKNIFTFSGIIGKNRILKEYKTNNYTWKKDQNTRISIFDFTYGFSLLSQKKFSLIPFTGIAITSLKIDNKDSSKTNKNKLFYCQSNNLIVGFNADYKIKTKLILVTSLYKGITNEKEIRETYLRLKFYITKAYFYQDLHGYTINIGLCLVINNIKIKTD